MYKKILAYFDLNKRMTQQTKTDDSKQCLGCKQDINNGYKIDKCRHDVIKCPLCFSYMYTYHLAGCYYDKVLQDVTREKPVNPDPINPYLPSNQYALHMK